MTTEATGRTAAEIVKQTEELALLLMNKVYQRQPSGAAAPKMRDSEDPRGQHCWRLACEIQEFLTATDPENALSELDDEPTDTAAPSDNLFELWWADYMPQAERDHAWRAYCAALPPEGA